MRIPNGKTDQVLYFVAVDATDKITRETGLTGFTVYRSRKGGAAAAMTTPTVAEVSSANMPGVYTLLLDEDMTMDSGSDSEMMVFHITCSGMAPVTIGVELYRPDAMLYVANTIETGASVQGMLRLIGAMVAGEVVDAGTSSEKFRAAVSDSKVRATMTVDASGNRTAGTYDLT